MSNFTGTVTLKVQDSGKMPNPCVRLRKDLKYPSQCLRAGWLILILTSSALEPQGVAADPQEVPNEIPAQLPTGPAPVPEGKVNLPEAEDFSRSPFTQYGEFNETADEERDNEFFQFGRFFGLSLGLGIEAPDGNRGALWKGGFPMIDFKLHYWFDFNFALDLGFYTASHYFSDPTYGQINVSMLRVGVDLRYYFDTRNLSGAVSFASPFVLVGIGNFSKSEYSPIAGATPTILNSVGASGGAGLEFTLNPKKAYLQFEGKVHFVPFYDSGSSQYQASLGLANLNGNFWTVSSNILLTW